MRAPFRASLLLTLVAASLPAQHAERAARAYKERRFAEARSDYEALFRANPRDASAAYWLGRIALAEDDSERGVKWMERAVALDDRNSHYHFMLGSALGDHVDRVSKLKLPFMAKRIKGAFDRAVQLDPNNLEAREGLRIFYVRAPSVMGGSMAKAREQAAEIHQRSTWRGHYAYAQLAEHEKRLDEAERRLQAAVAAVDSATPQWILGGFYQQHGRWKDAVATYERLLREHPTEVNAHLGIARSVILGDLPVVRAEEAVKAWMANLPKDAPPGTHSIAHQRMGEVLQRSGKPIEARAAFQRALELDPKNERAKKGLASVR